MKRLLLAACLLSLASCTPDPPPNWQSGGARLFIAHAYWERGEHELIEIKDNGEVYEDEDLAYVVDQAGRVVTDDHEPRAILLPDGLVLGTNDEPLGRVGLQNASPPDRHHAWLRIQPNGRVYFYDQDGEEQFGGTWRGCGGPMARTCTYITHMFVLRSYSRGRRSGPSFGNGIGVGL
jgi:hypothetical protein